MKKAILLIIDGLGDLPTPKTPLQAAKIPNFDKLAKNGITGLMSPIKPFVVPGSDTSHLQILGYDPAVYYCGRGPLEALGLGIVLKDGDVAFRANFATAKDGKIIDRRAGRVDTKTAALLSRDLSMKIEDVEIVFKNSMEHRGVLVLHGPGLSPKVTATDPHSSMNVQQCIALSAEAEKTARIINEFTRESVTRLIQAKENQHREKPANIVLLRGAGNFKQVATFAQRFRINGACVAGGALYKGVSRYIGMDVLNVTGATGEKNTDLKAKANAAVDGLKTHEFVFVHVKGCDSAGHDGDFKTKKEMLERIDKEMLPILIRSSAYIVITGDHSTPVSRKAHSG
ncbi:2,3-bisphosphoglycerate-independent phosphoglycerate mutase, partial [Candidatus Micrarchaeota archaeon]|nr:2,3-bisphosphoglycerate-independent phosphoglycerate mutase [Candidatus Micrarchaeota archaeon]